jgi:para-aminobenzoate synthetase/4-amino-4-deoxychorismate lyase
MNIDEIIKQVLITKGSAFFYTPSIYKNSKSYFFKTPEKVFTSSNCSLLNSSVNRFYSSIEKDKWGVCLLNYEAGYCYEEKLKKYSKKNIRIFYGLLFKQTEVNTIFSSAIKFGPKSRDYSISAFKLNASKKKYLSSIKKIKKYIKEGDTYQVNYTIKGLFNFSGDIADFFKTLIFNQSAKYSAIINLGDKIIISISPEMFFEQKGRRIKTIPMKGTIKRGITILEDELQKYILENSEKDRAENLMIVDMLRNDLGRISEYGSVKVTELFNVEKYESLYQMISTIKSKLRKDVRLPDILKNIFPCGSITGAPKMRTMEIINELEADNRGIYTGAIGIVREDYSIFNVAIRTVEINKKGKGKIGLGSGVVWDSDPEHEFEETLLKSRFLFNPVKEFQLFETMKVENGVIYHLDDHLVRLKKSAEYFLFKYDEMKIRRKLKKAIENLTDIKRIKLTLSKWGEVVIIISDYPEQPEEIKVIIAETKISSKNLFHFFKTTNRHLYQILFKEYSTKGFFDVLFFNEKGQLSEGTISNIFISKMGKWFTPAVNCGLLPGIERKHWINSDINATESILYMNDLLQCDELILTNSLRGRTRVHRLYMNDNEFRTFNS